MIEKIAVNWKGLFVEWDEDFYDAFERQDGLVIPILNPCLNIFIRPNSDQHDASFIEFAIQNQPKRCQQTHYFIKSNALLYS